MSKIIYKKISKTHPIILREPFNTLYKALDTFLNIPKEILCSKESEAKLSCSPNSCRDASVFQEAAFRNKRQRIAKCKDLVLNIDKLTKSEMLAEITTRLKKLGTPTEKFDFKTLEEFLNDIIHLLKGHTDSPLISDSEEENDPCKDLNPGDGIFTMDL